MKLEIPFQKLLTVVKSLSPSQKAKLRKELDEEIPKSKEKDDFLELLLNGPIFNEADIKIIEGNKKSISEWRTKK